MMSNYAFATPYPFAPPRDIPRGDGTWTMDYEEHREIFNAIITKLTKTSGVKAPPHPLTYDNVHVVGVGEQFTVDVHGTQISLRNREDWNRTSAPSPAREGSIGRLVLSSSGWNFIAYPDPTLRRAPELDRQHQGHVDPGFRPDVIGWRCAARPEGFCAPMCFIPGPEGAFLSDRTVQVTLRVPPEFLQRCEEVRLTAADVLRGFAADLAGVINWVNCPRVDGFSSNGSDERDMADAYFDRAFGHLREDAERQARAREDREEAMALRDEQNDVLDELCETFTAAGRGDREAFIAAIRESLNLDEATPRR